MLWNVKCLMSYIRVVAQGAGECGRTGEWAFPGVRRRTAGAPLLARSSAWFLRLSAEREAICGGLPGCGLEASADAGSALSGLAFVMWNSGGSCEAAPDDGMPLAKEALAVDSGLDRPGSTIHGIADAVTPVVW
ncbi:hypothetical protein BSFP_043490 [Burkholderia stabilis]|uniref:Uncharacterized protein n=1 Tax=Burkholderia stabilis TaxID=95485 RepID=A0A1Y1BNB5_9BURK|nr:hypothetical protein BSFP_043490 [Burkholderia stabilis]